MLTITALPGGWKIVAKVWVCSNHSVYIQASSFSSTEDPSFSTPTPQVPSRRLLQPGEEITELVGVTGTGGAGVAGTGGSGRMPTGGGPGWGSMRDCANSWGVTNIP